VVFMVSAFFVQFHHIFVFVGHNLADFYLLMLLVLLSVDDKTTPHLFGKELHFPYLFV